MINYLSNADAVACGGLVLGFTRDLVIGTEKKTAKAVKNEFECEHEHLPGILLIFSAQRPER